MVNGLLVKSFPEIVNTDFTARMEEQLDEVSDGNDLEAISKAIEEAQRETKKPTRRTRIDGHAPNRGSANRRAWE